MGTWLLCEKHRAASSGLILPRLAGTCTTLSPSDGPVALVNSSTTWCANNKNQDLGALYALWHIFILFYNNKNWRLSYLLIHSWYAFGSDLQINKKCWTLSVFNNWQSRSLLAIDVVNMFCVIPNTQRISIPAPWNLLSEQQLLVDSIFAELIKTHFRFDQIIFQCNRSIVKIIYGSLWSISDLIGPVDLKQLLR